MEIVQHTRTRDPYGERRHSLAGAGQRPCHEARALTGDGTEATIRLDGTDYVLHITRQGKLILTK